MRKSTILLKRLVALFLVVLMSKEIFATIVGDNDGAAFITKAEFDSMRNNFQSQLDRYNKSIDNKIDGAIANYLAGVKVSKKSQRSILVSGIPNVTMLPHSLLFSYAYGRLGLDYVVQYHRKNQGINNCVLAYANMNSGMKEWDATAAGISNTWAADLEYQVRVLCNATPSKKI